MIYIWATCLPESAPLLFFQVQMFQFARKINMKLGKHFLENQQSFRPRSEICKILPGFKHFSQILGQTLKKQLQKQLCSSFETFTYQYKTVQHFSKLVKTYQLFSVSPPASLQHLFQHLFSRCPAAFQHRFNVASTSLQHRFNTASTPLQQRSNSAPTALQQRFNSS